MIYFEGVSHWERFYLERMERVANAGCAHAKQKENIG